MNTRLHKTSRISWQPLQVVMAPKSGQLFPALVCPSDDGEKVLRRLGRNEKNHICVQFLDEQCSREFVDTESIVLVEDWRQSCRSDRAGAIGRQSRSQSRLDSALQRAEEIANYSREQREELIVETKDKEETEDDSTENSNNDKSAKIEEDGDYTTPSSQSSTSTEEEENGETPNKKRRRDDETEMKIKEPKLSEYEQLRLRNIAERQELMLQLGIAQDKKKLVQAQQRTVKTATKFNNNNNSLTKKKSVSLPPQSTRRSARLLKLQVSWDDTNSSVASENEMQFSASSIEARQEPQRKVPERTLNLAECIGFDEENDENLISAKTVLEQCLVKAKLESKEEIKCSSYVEQKHAGLEEYMRSLEEYRVSHVAKVTPTRISALALHNTEPLVTAADKRGHVALFNVANASNGSLLLSNIHDGFVRCLKFDSHHSELLHSASYDGSLRSFDIPSQSSNLSYIDSDSVISWIAQSEKSQYWLGFGAASTIGLVDARASNTSLVQKFKAFDSGAVKCVDLHPTKPHYLLAASGFGPMFIFDTRKIAKTSNQPTIELVGHKRSVESAFFSPCLGNQVCSLSHDNTIKVFDTSSLDSDTVCFEHSLSHDNHTGRWLTPFKARYHSSRDDVFFSGSMKSPRQIDVFASNSHKFALIDGNLDTVPCLVEAHANLEMIVGANASGKIFVFQANQFKDD